MTPPEPDNQSDVPIVDGHLDLAENVTLFGRDLTSTVAEIRAAEPSSKRQATVSLPDLRRGGVAVVMATVTPGFLVADVGPDFQPQSALYRTPEEAEAQALRQIDLYEYRNGAATFACSSQSVTSTTTCISGGRTASLVLSCLSRAPIPSCRCVTCRAGGIVVSA